MHSDFYDNAQSEQWDAIDWINDNLKTSHHCDSYVFVEYPQGHILFSEGEDDRKYWLKQFGMSRKDVPKGMALIRL